VTAIIRRAAPADVPAISQLISDLAEYEQALVEVVATPADLEAALFGPDPALFAHVAEHDGAVVGFALWFVNYSTWLGKHGIWLKDLYVTPAVRGAGIGAALLAELAAICADRGYGRLDWWVLDSNESALAFYRSLGAEAMTDWTVHRLTGPALAALARRRD
jgi:GNAT superfamily N-acetyltransferase